MILETQNIDDNNFTIKYLNESGDVLFQGSYKKSNDTFVQSSSKATVLAKGGCGQAVANCMADAYGGQGWKSVGLFVTTAFLPEVSLVVAGLCEIVFCCMLSNSSIVSLNNWSEKLFFSSSSIVINFFIRLYYNFCSKSNIVLRQFVT